MHVTCIHKESNQNRIWFSFLQLIFAVSAVIMSLRVFDEDVFSARMVWYMLLVLTALTILFEFLLPIVTKKAGHIANVWIRIFVAGASFGVVWELFSNFYKQNQLDLEDGLLWLGANYLTTWNSYYKKSYMLPPGKEEYASMAFAFCLLLAVIIIFLLIQITQSKIFVFLLPSLVLIAELLIGLAPHANGILCFSISCVMFSTGRLGGLRPRILSAILWGLLFGASMLLYTDMADTMVKKAPEYKAIQKKIETQLGKISIPNAWLGKEQVTNAKPEFSDKKVLSITADQKVNGNLYLKAFVGTSYSGSIWKSDAALFLDLCEQQHMNQTVIEDLLWNETAQNLCKERMVNYEISYQSVLSKALLPYLTNVSAQKKLQINGDMTIQKSVLSRTTKVTGYDTNHALTLKNTLAKLEANRRINNSNWNWYNDIVYSMYLDGNLDEAKHLAHSMKGEAPKKNDSKAVNEYRLQMATVVSDYLCNNYTYSMDLDKISKDTDPISYFLSRSKKGYCMHFASAGTLILREMGIPARYASGYVVKAGAFSMNSDGTYTAEVIDRNAHAWTEIYLENMGWLPVEMTAGYTQFGNILPTDRQQMEQKENEPETEDKTLASNTTETETETEKEADSEIETERNAETESNTETEANTETETDVKNDRGPADDAGKLNFSGDASAVTDKTNSSGQGEMALWWKTKTARRMIKLGGALLAIWFIILGIVVLIRRKKRRYEELLLLDMRRGKYNRAIKRINRRLYRKLKRLHVAGGDKLTDYSYEQLLMERFPQIEAHKWKRYMQIVKKAAFSKEEMQKEETLFCFEIYRLTMLDGKRCEP